LERNILIISNDADNKLGALTQFLDESGIQGYVAGDYDQRHAVLYYEPKQSYKYGNVRITPAAMEYDSYVVKLQKGENGGLLFPGQKSQDKFISFGDNALAQNTADFVVESFSGINSQISRHVEEVNTFIDEFQVKLPIVVGLFTRDGRYKVENGKISSQILIASDKELDLDLTEIIKQSNSAQKISDYTAKEISDKFGS
jgi:hypothetical protein